MRKPQIGVMGSAADLNYSQSLAHLAEELGRELAARGASVVYGAEKDLDSLSTAAGRGARSVGGLTIGVTYGDGLETYDIADVIINAGLARGGGREFSLVLSCDAIVTISGGSGTLNEMVVAYQAGIPIVALEGSGGWSEQMAGRYFDDRRRTVVVGCKDAAEAAAQAVKLARDRMTARQAENPTSAPK